VDYYLVGSSFEGLHVLAVSNAGPHPLLIALGPNLSRTRCLRYNPLTVVEFTPFHKHFQENDIPVGD